MLFPCLPVIKTEDENTTLNYNNDQIIATNATLDCKLNQTRQILKNQWARKTTIFKSARCFTPHVPIVLQPMLNQ